LESPRPEFDGVIFDDAGEPLPAHPAFLARRFGCLPSDGDVIAYAIQKLGFVYVGPIRDALLVKFEPSSVSHLAAFAAFYEIAGHAPGRLVLGSPGSAGSPERYEIFNDFIKGLKRVEAALSVYQGSTGLAAGPGEAAAKGQAGSSSKRLMRPLDSISSRDEWLGQLLCNWRNARCGSRLPSSETLDPLQLLNIARGRAHIVDTSVSNPTGYRFRVWGTVNSYRAGDANKSLGDMPASSMRDGAFEDHWEVVTTGVPTYQLIFHVEESTPYSYARLLLPLAADGRRVDQLVVLINERPLPELEAL